MQGGRLEGVFFGGVLGAELGLCSHWDARLRAWVGLVGWQSPRICAGRRVRVNCDGEMLAFVCDALSML